MLKPESVNSPVHDLELAAQQARINKFTPPAAARRVHSRPPAETPRKKILFLGNSYNPFSLTCFQSLLELPHDIFLGLYDPTDPGLWRLANQRLKLRGWDFVLRKTLSLAQAKARISLRRMGVRFSKFATLAELCSAIELNLVTCSNPNNPEFVERVRALGIDLIVVANFNRILQSPLLNAPRLGSINVHLSLLPRYRGPSPIYWVLANREKLTGITLHYMDEGIDTGDIIEQRKIAIRAGETQKTLWSRSGSVAAALLRESIPVLLSGKASRIPQDHSAASYYSWPPKWHFSL